MWNWPSLMSTVLRYLKRCKVRGLRIRTDIMAKTLAKITVCEDAWCYVPYFELRICLDC